MPGLLDEIPVLIYAGDADFICNWLGNRAWTEALGGRARRPSRPPRPPIWPSATTTAYGSVKSSGNFTYMRIFGAGHMVPFDQPEASLDLFNRWLGGEWHET